MSAEDIVIRIVTDSTMKYSALLGRDALRMLGLGLTKLPREEKPAQEREILNIEPSIFSGTEIDNLNINAKMSLEVEKRVRDLLFV